jgi:hypothetical protein
LSSISSLIVEPQRQLLIGIYALQHPFCLERSVKNISRGESVLNRWQQQGGTCTHENFPFTTFMAMLIASSFVLQTSLDVIIIAAPPSAPSRLHHGYTHYTLDGSMFTSEGSSPVHKMSLSMLILSIAVRIGSAVPNSANFTIN